MTSPRKLSRLQTGRRVCCSSERPRSASARFARRSGVIPHTGATYPWIVQATAMVNQYYFYAVDDDFGPFFLKFSSYFPYTAKLCINGNEWAKRQAMKAGLTFEPLDNGFASCEDPKHLQRICRRLGPKQINRLLRKWLARLPHPFTPADRRAGYRYEISVLQAEFSLTQVLDRPLSGRIFFEEIIRENIDIGRPDRVSLVFDRRIHKRGPRATPGRFRTPSTHERGHAVAARRVQVDQDQAVPQGGSCPPNRDHDQRQPRLRDPQAAVSSAGTPAGRLRSQSTSTRRPTDLPRSIRR